MVYSEEGTVGGSQGTFTLSQLKQGRNITYTQNSPSSATVVVATANGQVTGTIDLTQQSNIIRDGQSGVLSSQIAVTSSGTTDPNIAAGSSGNIEEYEKVVGLSYTTFGTWDVNATPTANQSYYVGTFGGGLAGVAQTASMPTSGSASYSGGAVGDVLKAGTANAWYGNSSLTANFATNGITGSITNINAYGVGNCSGTGNPCNTSSGTLNNINLTGTISGSAFSGTATAASGAGTAVDISGATGPLQGGFYGPSANEVAGTFHMTSTTGPITLFGAFGAKQPAAPSDARLKTDIETAGTLPNGLKLFSWRYLGGSHRFTGVMAQELIGDPRFADAVTADADGLMAVDYSAIGYLPPDFDLMRQEGEQAIQLYRRTFH